MKASIVIIGDEILIGRVADTNTPAIASALTACGFDVCGVRTVGDSAQDIHGAVVCAMAEADIVISTGGLGPTRDDITKSVLTDIFGGELRHDASVAQNVERVFARRGLAMNDLTRSQAMVPGSCRVIQNTVGTAPVMWFEKDGKVLVAMPGVPAETRAMLPTVVDAVVERFHPCIERMRREFTVSGITESDLAERLAPFEDSMPDDFKLAYLPSPGRIVLRLEGPSLLFEGQAEALVAYLGDKLAGEGVLSPAELLLDALRKKGMTMATAESCTGGNIAHLLTSVAGCSDVFVGSVVSYSNDMKMRVLGVESSTLEKEGAVSRDTVLEMVRGVRKALGASCAVAASGIAGPGGATGASLWAQCGLPLRHPMLKQRVCTISTAIARPLSTVHRLLLSTSYRHCSMKTEIDALFAANRLDEAEQALLAMTADAYTLYMRGRIAWKRGLRREAITLYEESAEIEPEGEAATALEQARAIMAFYNKDLYNP